MKKRLLAVILAAALLCSGCSRLLERSYYHVEPYTDRFREDGAADTLKAERYQDLVNALLLLLEQHAEEGEIRFYAEEGMDVYGLTMAARQEVLEETVVGSYLLEDLTITGSPGPQYHTLSCRLVYRAEAEDPKSMITISDSRSLVDLLRVAAREGHSRMAARFGTSVSRHEVSALVESLWRELYLSAAEERLPAQPVEGTVGSGEAGKPMIYPPCPWEIRFYPGEEQAGIVEIRFTGGIPGM